VAWLLFWVILASQIDAPVGNVGTMIVAVLPLFSVERIHRAVWVIHRYWFTTWHRARIAISLMAIGVVLKFAPWQGV
jgi:hypothetical protein